jgi:drug/metabolite transporter (DMT)-like permease
LAVDQIGAGLATLVANSQVVLVPLATWAILGERPTRRALVAMPVVMAGLAAVTGLGSADAFGARPVLGVAFGIVAAGFYTGFLIAFRRSSRANATPIGPLFDATLGAAAVIGLVGALGGGLDVVATWPAHGWLLALALGAQTGGWLAIGYALPRLPATVTSFVIVLQPILTIIWGRLIFGEAASPIQMLGVVVVVSGILAVVTGRQSPDDDRAVTSRQ